MSGLLNVVCKHCETPAGRLILTAMLQDAGAKCSNDAVKCWAREDGGDHEFVDPSELRKAKAA